MPTSEQPTTPHSLNYTSSLAESALVKRALAGAPIPGNDAGLTSHIRQTEVAHNYHSTIGDIDAKQLEQLRQQEIARAPDYRRIHKGSQYGLGEPHPITKQQALDWKRSLPHAPRRLRGVRAFAGALPPITPQTLRFAEFLANHSIDKNYVLYAMDKLAEDAGMDRVTVWRAVRALQRHGKLEVRRRWKRIWNGYQLQRVQARNDYVILTTRTPPGTGGIPLWH